ncbi:MAG: hypothetical protein GY845_01215 [Planctomycetes bacterium]|nr:hypothetical protein [Planctomycetota bacterium]
MNAHEIHVSVIDPIGPAFERVKTILFRPFDFGKWFVIGFCAWLAYLGSGGGGGGGGGGNSGGGGRGSHNVQDAFGQAKHFVMENLHWIIPVAAVVVVLGIAIWLAFTWLSSRGRFMFLHCVAHNKAEVSIPWTKFRQHANSLFLFRIVLGLISFVVIGLPILFAIGCIVVMIAGDGAIAMDLLGGILIGLFILVGAIIFGLISKFTMDFVVPIMFLRTTSCTAGWREFMALLSVNKARFTLYILFQIVIGIAIGTITLIGFCITCCFCCLGLIPYISTVILLPVHVFTRSYSLLYLKQFGPEFDVFTSEMENCSVVY